MREPCGITELVSPSQSSFIIWDFYSSEHVLWILHITSLLSLALLLYATVPQVCLFSGIPLYPEVSNPWFTAFAAVYVSSLCQHLYEVLSSTDGSFQTWWNEQRIWAVKALSGGLFGFLDATMKCLGRKKVNLSLTNKAVEREKLDKYEKVKFDFQGDTVLMVPTSYASSVGQGEKRQVFLSFFILVLSYPILDGMVTRKREGKLQAF